MRWLHRGRPRDAGFTLVELLVAATVSMVIGGMLLSFIMTTTRSARATTAQHDMNEEARNALNRVARELRQASEITYAINPDGPAYSATGLTAITFRADFNGDGCIGNSPTCAGTNNASNPEEVTYCYDPQETNAADRQSLWLIPASIDPANPPAHCSSMTAAQPILAGHVAGFELEYRSNDYRFDANHDGITTWEELDSAPPPLGDAGGSDGNINTPVHTSTDPSHPSTSYVLEHVNSVVVSLTMSESGKTQTYDTQVDLRNRS
jgi:type II secretory pathway pseudopilin PulG